MPAQTSGRDHVYRDNRSSLMGYKCLHASPFTCSKPLSTSSQITLVFSLSSVGLFASFAFVDQTTTLLAISNAIAQHLISPPLWTPQSFSPPCLPPLGWHYQLLIDDAWGPAQRDGHVTWRHRISPQNKSPRRTLLRSSKFIHHSFTFYLLGWGYAIWDASTCWSGVFILFYSNILSEIWVVVCLFLMEMGNIMIVCRRRGEI
jgi:hypothetical protein